MRDNDDETGKGAGGGLTLHRSIGPTQMALYGLGSMLGAGVYGLMGNLRTVNFNPASV